ncbi:MAG: hypothetical protein HC880_10275 [Bacteroidia bacterium]|nr:hypothetical protein [Bacteroidia bacterium]
MGLAQGFLLALVFLVSPRGNRRSNRILGALLLSFSFIVFEIFACYTHLIAYFPAFINLTEPLDFLTGPLVYLYTLSLIQSEINWRRKWVHFVPAFIFLILRMPYLLQSPEFKLYDVLEVYHRIPYNPVAVEPVLWFPTYHFGGLFMDLVSFPYNFAYQLYCFWLVTRFARQRRESFWKSSHPTLRWLVGLMMLTISIWSIAFMFSLGSEDDTGDIYIAAASTVMFYGVSLYLVLHSHWLGVSTFRMIKRSMRNPPSMPKPARRFGKS